MLLSASIGCNQQSGSVAKASSNKTNPPQQQVSGTAAQEKSAAPDKTAPDKTAPDKTASKQTASDQQARESLNQIVGKGVAFLLEKGRDREDGSYSKQLSPAVTALCISALVRNGLPVGNKKIQQSLKWLEGHIKDDGGIYAVKSNLKNYETSVALVAFHQCNVDGKYDIQIENATNFLKGIQWDEGEEYSEDHKFYGGQGYGKHERPDLSNTSYFMDSLAELSDDTQSNSDAKRKAVIFISRCQNLPSEHNSAEFAEVASDDDRGGMIYSAVGKGETKAAATADTPQGGLRSYASMTYAGLKSYLYAGLDKDDIRVKAALDWISRHYDLDNNPGMGKQGLYYYYHVFARTLHTLGQPTITDSEGKAHQWRADLIKKLAAFQKEDGSWINEADRWYESDPNLVTAYSLLALSYCRELPQDAANSR